MQTFNFVERKQDRTFPFGAISTWKGPMKPGWSP